MRQFVAFSVQRVHTGYVFRKEGRHVRVAMMVRGYLTAPQPSDIVYVPIDLAIATANGLSLRGHHVDFFGPTGSNLEHTRLRSRNLRPIVQSSEAFRELLGTANERMNHYIPSLWDNYLAEEMFTRAQRGEYDLLHFHHPEVALPLAHQYRNVPVVCTLNDPVYPWYKEVFELYDSPNLHFVSISNNQRRDAPDLRYADTVYNGVDTDDFSFSAEHEDFLLYVGRIVSEKGVKEAVQIAEATDHRLLIIGPISPNAQGYFDQYIKPHLNEKILYLGLIERNRLLPYYQNAKAFLAPLQWEEPFGVTIIEAMACGTPVIAIARGSMPEIIKDGKTGFLTTSIGEMIEAVGKVNKIDRRACREHVKANFGLRQMIDGYEKTYQQVLASTSPVRRLKRKVSGRLQQSLDLTTKAMSPKRLPRKRS